VFFDMPDLIVNLNTGTSAARRTNFLKISVSLELENPGDIEVVTQNMPRIIDNFQIYLRELRIDVNRHRQMTPIGVRLTPWARVQVNENMALQLLTPCRLGVIPGRRFTRGRIGPGKPNGRGCS
jgi:hypothetical protein